MRSILKRKGQNTAEYAILIALVVAAAVAMQTYVKRGMQGRMRDSSDRFYDNFVADTNWDTITKTEADVLKDKQFEPTELESQATQETLEDYEKADMASIAQGGTTSRETIQRTKQAKDDYQKYDY